MFEKVKNILTIYGMLLPKPVKGAILEMASEIDRLRAEVNAIRETQQGEK